LGSIKAWFFSSENKEEVKELFYDGFVLLITLPFISLFSYVGFSITEHIFNTDVQVIKGNNKIIVECHSMCFGLAGA